VTSERLCIRRARKAVRRTEALPATVPLIALVATGTGGPAAEPQRVIRAQTRGRAPGLCSHERRRALAAVPSPGGHGHPVLRPIIRLSAHTLSVGLPLPLTLLQLRTKHAVKPGQLGSVGGLLTQTPSGGL
jgi:hypothetical protein